MLPVVLTPPLEPTQYMPGTPEKVEVMRQRREAGQYIHHPDDAKELDDIDEIVYKALYKYHEGVAVGDYGKKATGAVESHDSQVDHCQADELEGHFFPSGKVERHGT